MFPVWILRSFAARSGNAQVYTIDDRLTLRCLLPHCGDRCPLTMFWEAASENAIARATLHDRNRRDKW